MLACIWPEATKCYIAHPLIYFLFVCQAYCVFSSLRCLMRIVWRIVIVYWTDLDSSSVLYEHDTTNC